MSLTFAPRAAVSAALLLFIAVPSAVAQTPGEAACRSTIARESAKYLKLVLKTVDKCHRSRNRAKVSLSVDCNDVSQADGGGRLEKARTAFFGKVVVSCSGAPALLDRYGRCPSPAAYADDGGATQGIDTYEELALCLRGLIDGHSGHAGVEAMGLPALKPTAGVAKCQAVVGKSLNKLLVTISKERARCQAARDANGLGLDYACNTADPDGKIGAARAKFDAAVTAACNVDDDPSIEDKRELDALGACGDTAVQLQACVGDVLATRLGAGLVAMAYELPAACTAGAMQRYFKSGGGDAITATFLSTGWNGTAHLVDVIGEAHDPLLLACDDDCANCEITLDPRVDEPRAICRCESNPTTVCDTINGADLDDCGLLNNVCNCNLGSPLALSSGGVPVCVLNRYTQDHGGTVDLGTGQWDAVSFDNGKVFLGENTQLEPCPTCQNDPAPGDGVRGGTCSRGLRLGMACDETASHPDFGPVSLDCPPNSVTNVSGSGLLLTLDFSTVEQSLPFELPCDAPPGRQCPCRVCSGNANLGCSSDAECAAAAAGTCTVGGGAGVQPNACDDGVCTCDDDVCTSGICEAGPSEMFCDAIVRQNGRGFLQCNTTVDCAALGAGSCTIQQNRSCYPDPLEITGSGTPYGADLSSLFCIPTTNSAAVNNSAGLPGAGATTLNMDMDVLCASDSTVIWEPPAGVNCP